MKISMKYNGNMIISGDSGIVPHIGDNGNWFIGTTDTGVTPDLNSAVINNYKIESSSIWTSSKINSYLSTAISDKINAMPKDFITEDGFGGIRFYLGKWQYYDKNLSTWVDMELSNTNTFITDMIPNNMQYVNAINDGANKCLKLYWIEPKETEINQVEGLKIVLKKDSIPEDIDDGDIIKDVKCNEFGKHETDPYIIEESDGLVDGVTYFIRWFPYNLYGIYRKEKNECSDNIIIAKYMAYKVYGFKFDQNESDPFSNITYLEDNINFRSAKMDYVNDVFDYGDWKDVWFIKNCKPCMLKYDGTVDYYLDKNDYSKKEDGSASDIADTSYGGNVMIEFPIVYYKIEENDDDSYSFYFSNNVVDDTFKPWWSFYDKNGNIIQKMYMATYNGSNVSSVLRSISGVSVMNSQTGTNEITYANANNTSGGVSNIWDTELYCDRQLINMLLMLIGKSTDTQTVFGNGNIYSDSGQNAANFLTTGTMNNKGLFWGSNSTTTHIGVKVFGIENYWGNQFRRIRGLINDGGTQKIKLTYGQQDGSTVDGYNTDGTGYISVAGATPSGLSGGYISKCVIGEYGIIPYQTSGSASTYECDVLYYSNNQIRYAYVGGSCYNALLCGAFAVNLNTAVSNSYSNVGASISCKPLLSTTTT